MIMEYTEKLKACNVDKDLDRPEADEEELYETKNLTLLKTGIKNLYQL